jgi:N-acylglucosamine 2-epimerase
MIMLNLIEEVGDGNYDKYKTEIEYCFKKIEEHFIDGVVHEFISEDGSRHDSAEGRLLNPGHAIEAGWFLLHWAERTMNKELMIMAADIIRSSFARSWDEKYNGIFYFLDSEGKSPVQLEWDMKLWWPHCEAMYAFMLLYKHFKNPEDWNNFIRIKEYSFEHFSDPEYGEWFGYLNRRGEVTHRFKGGPYKGCFHVPRALWLCLNTFNDLQNNPDQEL